MSEEWWKEVEGGGRRGGGEKYREEKGRQGGKAVPYCRVISIRVYNANHVGREKFVVVDFQRRRRGGSWSGAVGWWDVRVTFRSKNNYPSNDHNHHTNPQPPQPNQRRCRTCSPVERPRNTFTVSGAIRFARSLPYFPSLVLLLFFSKVKSHRRPRRVV